MKKRHITKKSVCKMQLKWAIWWAILFRKTFNPFLLPFTWVTVKTFTHRTQNKPLLREQKYLRLFLTKFWILRKANYFILNESVDQNEKSQENKKIFLLEESRKDRKVLHTYMIDFLTRIHFTVWIALGSLLLAAQWSGIFPSISGIPIFESCFMRSFTCSGLL